LTIEIHTNTCHYVTIHSESKKLCHCIFVHNFNKCRPIFKILSLLYSPRNSQQNSCHVAHHILDVSLHYPYPKILRKLCLCTGCDKKETGCTRASAADTFDLHQVGNAVPWMCPSWSEWSVIDLICIDVAVKINNAYYCEVLLTQKLLPVMRKICGELLNFQQGSVPACRARGTMGQSNF